MNFHSLTAGIKAHVVQISSCIIILKEKSEWVVIGLGTLTQCKTIKWKISTSFKFTRANQVTDTVWIRMSCIKLDMIRSEISATFPLSPAGFCSCWLQRPSYCQEPQRSLALLQLARYWFCFYFYICIKMGRVTTMSMWQCLNPIQPADLSDVALWSHKCSNEIMH